MKIAINKKIDFKPQNDDRASFHLLATGFQNYDLSIKEIAYYIGLGYPFCAQHQGRRKRDNYLASNAIPVDIDWNTSMQDVLEHPFVKKFAGIVYHTWSSTPAHNRIRVVFFCLDPITDAPTMESALTGALRLLGGDEACKDACRMFYGNKKSTPIVLDNVLTEDALNQLIQLGTSIKPVLERDLRTSERSSVRGEKSQQELDENQLVKTTAGLVDKLSQLRKGDSLYCPFHDDKNPSAFVTESRSGIKGIHCSSCAKTFWQKPKFHNTNEYDFNFIDKYLNESEFMEGPDHQFYEKKHEEFFRDDQRFIQPRNSKWLGKLTLEDGIILVRSPIGTGKTKEIAEIFQECKKRNLSVLLIGHRRTLIYSLAERIGLEYYLNESGKTVPPSKHYAICVDSIPRLIDVRTVHYDVVILDESEQVLSHFTSSTLDEKRGIAFSKMQYLIKKAKTVIACDADLNYLTLCSLSSARSGETPTRFYVNRYQHPNRSMEIYDSEDHLISDLVRSIHSGGRIYVCCNSKRKVGMIEQVISNSTDKNCKVNVVTSDNTSENETMNFIKSISEEILLYDVIISSPSLGTGIDISFHEDAQLIDGVYGFFDADITSHFDVAQQLGRVRNPKYVKAWLSTRPLNLPTDPEIIKQQVVESGEFAGIKVDYDSDGFLIFDRNDPLLSLFAEVISIQNLSKNNLRKNFINHKNYGGCEVVRVKKDDLSAKYGATLKKTAKKNIKHALNKSIEESEEINNSDAKKMKKFHQNDPSALARLQKFTIEDFYGQTATEKIITMDAAGKYRPKITLLAGYLEYLKDIRIKDQKSEVDSEKFSLILQMLKLAKLVDEFGNLVDGNVIDNRDLKEFKVAGMFESQRLKELLGITVRSDIDTKPMTLLGDILAKIGLRWNKAFKKMINSHAVTFYSVDYEHYQWAKRVAEHVIKKEKFWALSFINNS
jgi:hypothetical protein